MFIPVYNASGFNSYLKSFKFQDSRDERKLNADLQKLTKIVKTTFFDPLPPAHESQLALTGSGTVIRLLFAPSCAHFRSAAKIEEASIKCLERQFTNTQRFWLAMGRDDELSISETLNGPDAGEAINTNISRSFEKILARGFLGWVGGAGFNAVMHCCINRPASLFKRLLIHPKCNVDWISECGMRIIDCVVAAMRTNPDVRPCLDILIKRNFYPFPVHLRPWFFPKLAATYQDLPTLKRVFSHISNYRCEISKITPSDMETPFTVPLPHALIKAYAGCETPIEQAHQVLLETPPFHAFPHLLIELITQYAISIIDIQSRGCFDYTIREPSMDPYVYKEGKEGVAERINLSFSTLLSGHTALLSASLCGNKTTVEWLLNQGADGTAQVSEGCLVSELIGTNAATYASTSRYRIYVTRSCDPTKIFFGYHTQDERNQMLALLHSHSLKRRRVEQKSE